MKEKEFCFECGATKHLVPYPLPSSMYRLCTLCLRARKGKEKKDPVGYKRALEAFTGPVKDDS